jgi:predicted aldo/keto reductase-like oxidoreductase
MSANDPSPIQRREFLQAGALASAATLSLGSKALADEPKAEQAAILPTRKLGKTGVDVTILNHGTWLAPGALDRLMRTSYAAGVRYFDTAKVYKTEPAVAKWLQAMPEVRKNIFLATKDWPKDASQMAKMLDERLATLKVDYVDLFFVHALGDNGSAANPIKFAGSPEFAEAIEKIKKSGKAKFVGFSTHHETKAQIIQSAADAGFVDVIMVAFNPWVDKGAEINKALDAAHKKGIGLISMKQISGTDAHKLEMLGEVSKHVPELKERGLTPYQGLLQAIWSDERFSTSCVSMHNLNHIAENTEAARKFKPLKTASLEAMKRAFLASKPTMCANCDGSCSRAAGTEAELGNLTRFLTYHEHHGHRSTARQEYSAMADAAKNWQGADLAAAQAACHSNLDFSELLPKVERYLA